MNREDVIRMARKVGFGSNSLGVTFTSGYLDDHLERFANLVAAAEREACAKVAQEFLTQGRSPLGRAVGDAIRARGQG